MGDNLDNVFVLLSYTSQYGMPVLEWALDHFDSDKTKIVLTPHYGLYPSEEFVKTATGKYLPRCPEKKFRAEILIPEAQNTEDSVLELVNKRGMNKLVYWAHGWNSCGFSTWFGENPTICCKIWVVNEDNGELTLVRDNEIDPGLDAQLQTLTKEVESSWNNLAKKVLSVHTKSMTKLKLNADLLMEEHKKHFEKSLARSEQRNSDLIMEKEQTIKELQEEIVQKLELESNQANEIYHLKNEMELLSKDQIEEKLLLMGCKIDPAFSAELEEATSELEKFRKTASEESKRREKVEREMLGTYDKAMLTMSKVGRQLKIRDEEHKKEIKELLQREKDERQQEVEHLNEKNRLLTEENEQLKIENKQSEIKLADNLCKIQEANEHKETSEKRIADIELALKTVNEHLDSLQLHHSKLQEDRDKLEEERGHAIKEAEELRKEREDMGNRLHSNLSSDFTLQELEQATQNFSDSLKLGEGGFGCVYKGILRGMAVAVKKLNHDSIQGVAQFQQEVAILTRIRHPHLVTLLGSCSEASALVYEILPNGSLEDRLSCNNNTPPLTWQVRTRIIGEICLALIFLHSSKPYLVVHGDLDPQNILLDSNFVSKLGDFGISRLIKQPDNHYVTPVQFTNNPAGKFAYTDPEYMSSGELTPKSDIYSLGIVILRLLTGQSPRNIARRVDESIKNGSFRSMVDGSAGNWPFDQAIMLAEIGLKCANMSRSARPDLVTGIWAKMEPLMKDASIVLEENHIPHHFICPILQDVMKNPHIAADGFTYESEAIQRWLNSGHNTSPMTNLQLPHHDLIPNLVLRSAIQEWLQLHPQP